MMFGLGGAADGEGLAVASIAGPAGDGGSAGDGGGAGGAGGFGDFQVTLVHITTVSFSSHPDIAGFGQARPIWRLGYIIVSPTCQVQRGASEEMYCILRVNCGVWPGSTECNFGFGKYGYVRGF